MYEAMCSSIKLGEITLKIAFSPHLRNASLPQLPPVSCALEITGHVPAGKQGFQSLQGKKGVKK